MRKLLIETSIENSGEQVPSVEETRYGQAGTDSPWYNHDGIHIEADYGDDDARPFGYWPTDPNSNKLYFFMDDGYDDGPIVHNDVFANAFSDYIYHVVENTFGPVEDALCEKLNEFFKFVEENGLQMVERSNGFNLEIYFAKAEGDGVISFRDKVAEIFSELNINAVVTNGMCNIIYNMESHENNNLDSFIDDFFDDLTCNYIFSDEYDQENVCRMFNLEADDIFKKGRLEGRIWLETELITFYPGQQPSRDEMKQVISDIANHEGMTEEELYNFMTIFEVGSKKKYTGCGYKTHDDATIQCCTVADYIAGKYNGFNREEEIEMVKNRKGADRMVHLANQKDKFEFFKDFRKTRDRAVYTPREKGAGTLAAYHAMRYPFSESRMITELEGPSNSTNYNNSSSLSDDYGPQTDYDYSDNYSYSFSDGFEAGTDFPLFYDEKRGKEFGGDWHSPKAFPFAYFEVAQGQLEFFIGDGCSTHSHLAFNVAKDYYLPNETSDKLMELAKPVAVEINKLIEPAINGDKEKYNWLINNLDEASNIVSNSSLINNYDIDSDVVNRVLKKAIRISLLNEKTCSAKSIKKDFYDNILETCYGGRCDDDDVRVWWLDSLFKFTDLRDGDEYFENGRMEGRIFTHENAKTISFYDEQQPNSEELDTIIKHLVEKTGISYDEFMEYEIIYRNWDETYEDEDGYDRGRVTGCSVYEYITGKPMDEFINPEERKGSQFIPHLASPEEKFNFFKDFRNARDKAIYVPREKAAGTLAAYHAMRYPYGESRKSNGRLLTESGRYNEAGTDFPCFYDKKTDTYYEATWNGTYGFPFGYWPINDDGDEEFFCGEPYKTHAQTCGQAAQIYIESKIDDIAYGDADNIKSALDEFIEYYNDNGFVYDEDNDNYVSEKLDEVQSADDLVDFARDDFYYSIEESWDYLGEIVLNWLEYTKVPSYGDIANDIKERVLDKCSFDEPDDIDESLEFVGTDFEDFFERGHGEGRIWPYEQIISFYPTEQPSPDDLEAILYNLSDYMKKPFESFMDYFIIFENPKDDWEVTGCTIRDYLDDNYGPFDEEDDDEEVQYARDGKTVFIPHLAKPEEKFNFFKAFRDTRDKAIFAPREKGGGGTLAGYHAMRYPFGENRIIKEDYQRRNEAGTDSPYFHDLDTGFEIEGYYDDSDACPFGYFRYDIDSTDLKLFCCYDCDYTSEGLHRDLIKKIIMDNVDNIIEKIEEHEDEIIASLKEYQYNTPNKYEFPKILTEIFEDAGVEYKPTEEFAERLYAYLSQNNWNDSVLSDGLIRDFADELWEYWVDSDEAEIYYGDAFNVSYSDILYSGRLLGRIWENKGLITFYPGQQPSRDEMNKVITDLSSKIGIEYDDLLNFYTIFETGSKTKYTGTGYRGHDDATIQCCTVADYIEGKYNGFNREEEIEMVNNRKGVDQLNIHLANQKDKFNFFKGFRDTRDKAIYVPREKGAGSLAAYHAMRYPYGENRKRFLQMIDEEVDLLLEGNGTRAKRQTIGVIADRFGFDMDSPYAIDLENKFKTMFFHHGLDNDRYIVFEPNLCRCALDLGFGTPDFTNKDVEYISDAFNLIYKYIDTIQDVPTRQAELKRIKDSIISVNNLRNVVNELQPNLQPTEDEERASDNEEKISQLQNGYTLIGPVDYDTAHEYGKYSNPKGKLCYTQDKGTWDRKYSKKGMNTCYILLKDGWEDVQPVHDGSEKDCYLGVPFNEFNGYDNYGMSMIFIFVNPQGNLAFANGRWNHGAEWPSGYKCDNEYTEQDITRLVGQPFKKVFKSAYNFDELLEKALEKLKNGAPITVAFDKTMNHLNNPNEFSVELGGMCNLFNDGKIVSPIWFDEVHGFGKFGLAYGKVGDTTYLFDAEGKRYTFSDLSQIINTKLANGDSLDGILSKNKGSNDFATISLFGKSNVVSLKTNKVVFPNIWFDSVSVMNGLATGKIGDKKYMLFEDGKIISLEKALKTIIDNIEKYPNIRFHLYDVNNETSCIEIFGKYYYIRNSDNKLVNNKGFDIIKKQSNSRFVWGSDYDGTNNKYALDLKTGNIMEESEFYSYIWELSGVNTNGSNEKYYQQIEPAGEGIYRAYFKGEGWNYIKDGKLMFKQWFRDCSGFEKGLAKVKTSDGWKIINSNGEFLTKYGCEDIGVYGGKYVVAFEDIENENYNGDNDEYITVFSITDLSTGECLYENYTFDSDEDLRNTTLGEYYITDGDEIGLVFTKDGQMLDEFEYAKLIGEEYRKTKDLNLFYNPKGMSYGYEISYGYKLVVAASSAYNILDRENNLVLNEWAWGLHDFIEGRMMVRGDKSFNYLDENLNPILKDWTIYQWGYDFKNGYAIVYRRDNKKAFIIDKNGNIAFDKNGYEHIFRWNDGKLDIETNDGERYNAEIKDGQMIIINRK